MDPVKKKQKIVVQIANNFPGLHARSSQVKKLVETVLNNLPADRSPEMVLSIAIVDDIEIRKLNTRFLNRKAATDCLSFDLSDNHGSLSPKFFELIVNGQMAVRQANSRGHASEAELALYITHGLLHNLGFDDSTEISEKKMHLMEDKILQQLGYGLVYNKNTKA
jgi:probable rRNA maturation factor